MSSLATFRDEYIRQFRVRSQAEMAWFATGTFTERVIKAATAQLENGGKHKHQWRIPPALLCSFAERLVNQESAIEKAESFAGLFTVVRAASFKGIGELTVYDTAVRIGAGQNLHPDSLYLHAGTLKGAKWLGWNTRREFIPRSDIPSELKNLSTSEIEDLLCIFFGSEKKRGRQPNACSGIVVTGCIATPSNRRVC